MLVATSTLTAGGLASAPRGPSDAPTRVVPGTPEKKATPNGKLCRWHQRDVTITVDPSVDALGPRAFAVARDAFRVWERSGADVPSVSVQTGKANVAPWAPDGVNAVVVAPIELPGHGEDLAVTVTFVDEQTGEIVEADVIINSRFAVEPLAHAPESNHSERADEPDTVIHGERPHEDVGDASPRQRYDLGSVVAHEAGHFFGLGEDHQDEEATMFYRTLPNDTRKRSLEPTDVETMVEVYADGYEEAGEIQCHVANVGRRHRAGGLGLWLGLTTALGAATRLRRRRAPHE